MLGYRRSGVTDDVLNALGHPLRRRLLFTLHERDSETDPLPLRQVPGLAFDDETHRTALHHAHLPKLEDLGYVHWNTTEETVRRGPKWNQIDPLLGLISDHLDELPPPMRGLQTTA